MWIDILFILCLVVAAYWGWKQGIIHMLFTIAAYFAGMILAVYLNAKVAVYLSQFKDLPPQLLPLASFFFILLFIILLFRVISWTLQKILQSFHLENVNRTIGSALSASLMTFLLSLIIWYSSIAGFVPESTQKSSFTYTYLYTFAPSVLDGIGYIVPGLKSVFPMLENVLDNHSKDVQPLKQV